MPGHSNVKPFTSSFSNKHRGNMTMLISCFLLLGILLCFPGAALPLIRESILIWYQNLLPALFPAMILSNIILYILLNTKHKRFHIPLLSSVYHTGSYGCLVLLLGFLCGFPIGAYLCAKLVREQQLGRRQGQYLLGFCNNLSPVFLISVYCRLFPQLPQIPVLLLFYGCPLIYGAILSHCITHDRMSQKREETAPLPTKTQTCSQPGRSIAEMIDYGITDALSSIVRLAGYVIFFRLLLLPLRLLEPGQTCSMILGNLIEITSGIQTCSMRADSFDIFTVLLYTLPFMTFGGICCIGQTICMIRDSGLSIAVYVRDKLLQSILLTAVLQLCSCFLS